jgi:hydroxyacylglutathione hydrolase
MILDRSMNQDFTSNSYLIGDHEGGSAAFIDAGGPMAPLIEAAAAQQLNPTHVLLTHHHHDHVLELGELTARYPGIEVLAHPLERELLGEQTTGTLEPGDEVAIGDLRVRALHTPGHTAGMLALVVDGTDVFTGDTLFKGSVGGVRAPGSTSYADLRDSVMNVLMALPPETRIHPGHTDPSTVAEEFESNPFVRIWRGLDPEGDQPCTAFGEDATLILLARDYDGGHKAWVRWPDGRDDIVPGSQVQTHQA